MRVRVRLEALARWESRGSGEEDRAVVSVTVKSRVGGRQACGQRTWLSLARCLTTLARRVVDREQNVYQYACLRNINGHGTWCRASYPWVRDEWPWS